MRNIGIELESLLPAGTSRADLAAAVRAEGLDCREEGYNHTTRTWWKVVTDASLGYEYGAELVSPILDLDADGFEQIRKVCNALQRVGAHVNRSCGLHVHHDMRGEGFKTWQNVAKLHARNELAMDSIVAPSRRANVNNMCKSNIVTMTGMSGADGVKEAFQIIGRTKNLNELRRAFRQDRFQKLNLEASMVHNTVEFRQHGGTIEFDKIEAWVMLTSSIVEDAKLRAANKGWFVAYSAPENSFETMLKWFKGPEANRVKRFLRRRRAAFASA